MQSDWSQNDETADDYIKNRFGGYYDDVETQIWPETTLTDFEETNREGIYQFRDWYSLSLIEGDKCRLIVDGTEYILDGWGSSGTHEYGNAYLYNESATDTGELFYIHSFVDTDAGGMCAVICTTVPGTEHIVEAYETNAAPIPIPEEYTPTLATKKSVADAIQLKQIQCKWVGGDYQGYKFIKAHAGLYAFSDGQYSQDAYKSQDNGRTWSALPDVPSSYIHATYGNGKFVLVACDSTSTAYYSEDAVSWNETTMPIEGCWEGIAYGNDRFVAYSTKTGAKYTAYSDDGVNWTLGTSLSNSPSSIEYINGQFLMVINGNIWCGSDGITWSTISLNTENLTPKSVVGGDGKLLAYAPYFKGYLYSADNGATWQEVTTEQSIRDVAYGAGLFVRTNGESTIYYSENLVDWIAVIPSGDWWSTVHYVSGQFIALAFYRIAYSQDGKTWEYTTDILQITSGTDATDRVYTALGIDSVKPSAYLATLSASSWDADALTQTVTVPGILADESKQMIIPMPTIACMSAYNDAGIQLTNQAADALTFTAQEMPTDDIQVYVSFQNVNLVTG